MTTPTPTGPVTFGRYELLKHIAVGGMAEIFLARSASFGGVTRACVIKRILPRHCANLQFVSMFIDEARIMIGLEHPGIIRIFDFGQVDGAYYMAMEYVDGYDLVNVMEHLAQRGDAMEPLAAAYVIWCLARALDYAHNKIDAQGSRLEIVHRDVSPHNVLVAADGTVKLADFGIAKAKNKLSKTLPGTVMGKFAYMAPEQALSEKVDARTDVFALGVVLYEMLTGERLFQAETPLLTITRLIESEVDSPSWVRAGIPEVLDRFVLKALKREKEKRFQSGAEMAAALATYLSQHRYDQRAFLAYLQSLVLPEERRRPSLSRPAGGAGSAGAGAQETTPAQDQRLNELLQQLAQEPDLWTLASVGERLLVLGDRVRAMAALRTAAAVFASRGLLVQAVIALEPISHLHGASQRERELQTLAHLAATGRDVLAQVVKTIDGGRVYALLGEAAEAQQTVVPVKTPLLGELDPVLFARLIRSAQVRHLRQGEVVLREGDQGEALYAIGRGRVVVYCSPPASQPELGDDGRVYLSSLAEGEFFGEFGFLTGSPRTATVEAIGDTWLLELERAAVDSLVEVTPELAEPLLEFYRERVAELLMAKSPVFAGLQPHQRKRLLARASLQTFRGGSIIVEEGRPSDAFFFVKRGEVEVYTARQGMPIFLDKLGEGNFFGEIGVIMGVPRTATVCAAGEVEVMRIDATDLRHLMLDEPQVTQALHRAAEERAVHSAQLVSEGVELLQKL